MADDLDMIDAMLEEPFQKQDETNGDLKAGKKKKSRSRSRSKGRRHRSRSGERRHKRSRSRDKKHGDKHERKRSRSRDRHERRHRRSRSRSRERRHRRSRSRSPGFGRAPWSGYHGRYTGYRGSFRGSGGRFRGRRSFSKSPIRDGTTQIGRGGEFTFNRKEGPQLSVEERDLRTVFCYQLSAKLRPRDLEDFFSSVGKVRDVRMITDSKSGRSKGIAYVEFEDPEAVTLALGLTGQKVLDIPIIVQSSQAERNRQQTSSTASLIQNMQQQNTPTSGPMRLYVGSLHFNITEEMLRGIFEPFGKIEDIQLMKDKETNRSRGYGFITFRNAEDARKALEQLNGFELAGRAMKVGHVTDKMEAAAGGHTFDQDEMDRPGIDLGTTGRLQLMAKLAQGTGFQIPQAAQNVLQNNPMAQLGLAAMGMGLLGQQSGSNATPIGQAQPTIATQCFMLSNMFDINSETSPTWESDIVDDVVEECNKHGGCVHVYVDTASPQGNVYVKCMNVAAAVASVNALHGRFFGGKVITAAYVPLDNYHTLFAQATNATALLQTSGRRGGN